MRQEERAVIDDIARRLTAKHAAFPLDHIAGVVQQAYARFHSSRVREFIPLLVERHADGELSALTPDLLAVAFGDLRVAQPKALSV